MQNSEINNHCHLECSYWLTAHQIRHRTFVGNTSVVFNVAIAGRVGFALLISFFWQNKFSMVAFFLRDKKESVLWCKQELHNSFFLQHSKCKPH